MDDYYITKKQALSAMRKATNCTWDDIWNTESVLDNLPAADVAPVVHGRWEWITENLYKCSHCYTKTVVDEFLNETLYMYCPYCGARMDGELE